MSKFLLKCSCIFCKEETVVQSLSQHFNKRHVEKSKCPSCNVGIFSSNKFCSSSCAARFNNSIRCPEVKTGPKPGTIKAPPYTKVFKCLTCHVYFKRLGMERTCSAQCRYEHSRLKYSKTIELTGFNVNTNRGRGKRSWLETSFSEWLKSNFQKVNFSQEHPFNRYEENGKYQKTYYADFYFPELRIIIELDGSQHKLTKEYDKERDSYILNNYDIYVIRVSHKEYQDKSKQWLTETILKLV